MIVDAAEGDTDDEESSGSSIMSFKSAFSAVTPDGVAIDSCRTTRR